MNRGQSFELRVYEAIKTALFEGKLGLNPDFCRIYHQKGYYSKDRKRDIKVDISIELYLKEGLGPSIVWVWECKDYSGSVSVEDVEEFHAKLEQIGADLTKGTIICSKGLFDRSAWTYAESKGIGLARLMPSEEEPGTEQIETELPSQGFLPEAGLWIALIMCAIPVIDFLLHHKGRSWSEYQGDKIYQRAYSELLKAHCDPIFVVKEWDFYGLATHTSGPASRKIITRNITSYIEVEIEHCQSIFESGQLLHNIKGSIEADKTFQPYAASDLRGQRIVNLSQKSAERVPRQRQKSTSLDSSLDVTNSIGMEFVWIPAGKFQMGSERGRRLERLLSRNECPIHTVQISKPYYLGKYPVTQAQWVAVMGSNPSCFQPDLNRPVEGVSWEDVQEFIRRLNVLEGGNYYRLPTEAEWEFACRAGSTSAYCFGDDKSRLGEYAWHEKNSDGTSQAVGQLQPNVWGLYDMHGNVSEWVQDRYGKYSAAPVTDPQGPSSSWFRVIRGGDWNTGARACRSAFRNYVHPSRPSENEAVTSGKVARTASFTTTALVASLAGSCR